MKAPATTVLGQLLDGTWVGHGLLEDLLGRVRTRFSLQSIGTLDGAHGEIAEHYQFDNAPALSRAWQLERGAQGWVARAEDVRGTVQLDDQAQLLRLRYTLQLRRGAGSVRLRSHDRVHALPDGTLLAHSSIRKFGLPVARLWAVYRRPAVGAAAPEVVL